MCECIQGFSGNIQDVAYVGQCWGVQYFLPENRLFDDTGGRPLNQIFHTGSIFPEHSTIWLVRNYLDEHNDSDCVLPCSSGTFDLKY
jgi:hypothetical protein